MPDNLTPPGPCMRTVAFATLPAPGGAAPLRCTISFGVATLGMDGEDVDTLLRSADAALMSAKQLGRDRVASGVHATA